MSLRPRRHDAYDDIEITDPRVMRALAHPVRLAALSYLQGHGPATATQLAPIVGASPSVTSWHLRHLAQHGLVSDWSGGTDGRQRWWKAAARGIRLMQPPDDESGADAAYRALSSQLIAQAMGQVRDWQRQVEPGLDTDWRAVAGISNTTVLATQAEIAEILDAVERLLAPYVRRRDRRAARDGERLVRMARLVLPGAAPDDSA